MKLNPFTFKLFSSRRKNSLNSRTISRGRWASRTSSALKIFLKIFGTLFGVTSGFLVIFALVGSIVVASYLGKINASLPSPDSLHNRTFEESTKIYDRNGTLLYTVYGDKNSEFVSLDKIPPQTKWALLSAEDKEFYDHKGLSVLGIIKASYECSITERCRGASTIDQQLIRITILKDLLGKQAYEKSVSRKLKEILITIKLDQELEKDEILEMYMNIVPLGGVNYGFQAASKAYFNKDVSDLTIGESAFLSGIIKSPNRLSPLAGGSIEIAQGRRDEVLDAMLKNIDKITISEKDKKTGKITIRPLTEEDIIKAKATPLALNPGKIDMKAPHFVFYVISLLEKKYGADTVSAGGLRVKTTLDLGMQSIAEEELKKKIAEASWQYGVNNASLVAINPKNGEILTMVGSVDYNKTNDRRVDGNVNVAVVPRQMGSSMKPYTYLEAFKLGYFPGTLAPDIEMKFGAYKVKNSNNKYNGLMSIRTAVNQSRNLPAVYTLQMIGGSDTFLNVAKRVGITSFNRPRGDYGLSITLGAAEVSLVEHTNVFSMYANRGVMYDPTAILEIKDKDGNELYKYKPQQKKIYDEKEVYLLNWVLCELDGGSQRLGSSYYKAGSQKLCGKTGTTNGPKDLSSMMYYPRLSVGVWSGNNNGKELYGKYGQAWSSNVPLIISTNFMRRVQSKFGNEWYTRPGGVSSGSVCKDTGYLAGADVPCNKEGTVYISSKTPGGDKFHKSVPICVNNNKVPTNELDARQLGLVKDTIFLDFTLQNSAHQPEYERYMNEKYFPAKGWGGFFSKVPVAELCPLGLGPNNEPKVTITSPANGVSFESGQTINITAQVAALGSVQSVEFFFDSGAIITLNASPYTATYTIPANLTGSHTITVKATDSSARIGTATINITINAPQEKIAISVTYPSSGLIFTPGQTITLSSLVSGNVDNITALNFYIKNSSNVQIGNEIAGSKNSPTNWTASYTLPTAPGTYTIFASALTSTSSYQSSIVTITIQ